jgi:hypothetical protein
MEQNMVMWWTLGGILAAALVFGGLGWLIVSRSALPYTRERKLSGELAVAGLSVEAWIISIERKAGGNLYAEHFDMTVRYADAAGSEQQAIVQAAIDEELAANFVPGKTVHLRYDPADPARIAIDRSKTTTFIPAAWRTDVPHEDR